MEANLTLPLPRGVLIRSTHMWPCHAFVGDDLVVFKLSRHVIHVHEWWARGV
jgi:hypothetical protein